VTTGSPPAFDPLRARTRRIVIIALITALVEIGLYLLARFAPALAPLVAPVYWIVMIVGLVTAGHALRRHPGTDRRRGDRRRQRRDGPG
jgi:hypothetical protein